MRSAPLFVSLLALLSLPGCATKDYGRQGTLTSYEAAVMSCRDIDVETSKLVGFIDQVNSPGEYRWYDVVSMMEEHWPANSLERNAALQSANGRLVQLWKLRDNKKCDGPGATQTMSIPVQKPEVEESLQPPSNL